MREYLQIAKEVCPKPRKVGNFTSFSRNDLEQRRIKKTAEENSGKLGDESKNQILGRNEVSQNGICPD